MNHGVVKEAAAWSLVTHCWSRNRHKVQNMGLQVVEGQLPSKSLMLPYSSAGCCPCFLPQSFCVILGQSFMQPQVFMNSVFLISWITCKPRGLIWGACRTAANSMLQKAIPAYFKLGTRSDQTLSLLQFPNKGIILSALPSGKCCENKLIDVVQAQSARFSKVFIQIQTNM